MYTVLLAFQCIYMDGVVKEVKRGQEVGGVRFMEEGREWRLPGFLYADDLVLRGDLEKDLREMI